MGKIYQLQDGLYQYELPDRPKHEDILFFDKKKEDQYWIAPDLSLYKRMPISEKRDWVEKIRKWWKEGLWFYNKGEPVYITGLHFDFLTLHTFSTLDTPDKRPRFFKSHKEEFYFRDLTWKDPLCHGRIFFKPRRNGSTLMEMAEMYYRGVEDFGRQVGMMSDEFKKTQDTLFRPMVDSMIHRPKYMRAEYYKPSNRIPKKELLFNSGIVAEDEDGEVVHTYLGGFITPKPTTVGSFDAYKLNYLVLDEIFKWTNASPKETWGSHKKVMEVAGRPIGIGSMLSTMGDSSDYESSVREGVEMYYESDPEIRDANGKTKNGCYRYFIKGVYYMNVEMADKYGDLDEEAAERAILNELANFTPGTMEYVFQQRRIPLTIEDALASATFSNIFDKKRIEAKLTILRKTPKDKLPYTEGELIEDNVGRVHWEPNSNGGPWRVHILPYMTKDFDGSNRWEKDLDGNVILYPNPQGAVGYDSVRIAVTDATSGNLSKAAIIVGQKFDYYTPPDKLSRANRYCALYHLRPEDPDVPTYESYKAAKFWGFPVMIERNVEGPRKWYRDMEIKAEALMMKGDDGHYGTLIHGRNNMVNELVNIFQKYIQKPLPDSGLIDWLLEIPFDRLLSDMKDFNPKKTTLYDVMMANLQLQAGLKKIQFTNLTEHNIRRGKGLTAMTPIRKTAAP